MKKISIIVPVYNTEKYLSKCLDSILSQNMKNIEIILINDNSKDSSEKILLEYQRKNKDKIKVINNKENFGAGKSRNIGLNIAEGEYISFIDSDDYIAKDMLEKMYIACEKTNSQVARVNVKRVYRGVDISFLGRNTSFSDRKIIIPQEDSNYLIKETPSATNKLFRKDIIKNQHFPENIKWEDYPFTIPILANAKKVVTIPDSYYFYTFNLNGTTANDLKRVNENILDIFTASDIIEEKCIKKDMSDNIKKQINYVQIQNCMQRLRDILCSNMPPKDKKELITLISSLIKVKYGNWEENKLYQEYKCSNKLYKLRMNIIEKFFLDDKNYDWKEEELKAKIKEKIKKNLRECKNFCVNDNFPR